MFFLRLMLFKELLSKNICTKERTTRMKAKGSTVNFVNDPSERAINIQSKNLISNLLLTNLTKKYIPSTENRFAKLS